MRMIKFIAPRRFVRRRTAFVVIVPPFVIAPLRSPLRPSLRFCCFAAYSRYRTVCALPPIALLVVAPPSAASLVRSPSSFLAAVPLSNAAIVILLRTALSASLRAPLYFIAASPSSSPLRAI